MDIKTRIKLNNGVQIPILGLGTWTMSEEKTVENAVLTALNVGYCHFDTASVYGNEKLIGKAIKKGGVDREGIFVTTKLWNTEHDDPRKALDNSLRRLEFDYVDLYLIHYPVSLRNRTWKAFEEFYKEDKCKAIGVSNFTVRHLEELIEEASIIPAVNQVEFSPYLYQKELLNYCKKEKIQLEAYSPLTHGERLNDARLVGIASKYGKAPAQILIRWAIQHGLVVIPKSANPKRIKENANVFDFKINKGDMERLDGFNEDFRVCLDPSTID